MQSPIPIVKKNFNHVMKILELIKLNIRIH